MTVPLFDVPEPPPAERLSADRRRTQRQHEALAAGEHPLNLARIEGGPVLVHPDAATDDQVRCGTCRHRELATWHNRRFAKCWWVPPSWGADQAARRNPPRVTHGAGSDVRASWPGCRDWELGDPAVGPDASRQGPAR